jgi:hypothetical protein
MRRLAAALDRYWFAPASLRDLALVRILAFGTQTLVFLHLRPLSEQLHQARIGLEQYRPIAALKVLLLPWGPWGEIHPSASFITATLCVAIAAGVLATVGLYARVTMLCAAAANTLLVAHFYSYGQFHHAEALMIIALNVLAVAPSAAVWSMDAARRRRRERRAPSSRSEPAGDASVFAQWPLRLMQWLIVLTYLSAAGSKLYYGGLRWVNGYTMTYHFMSVGVRSDREVALFVASLPPQAHILPSIFALLIELTFVVAVLVPRTAWLYVLAGTALHLAVYLTMEIAFFQTIVLYCVFIESLRRYWPKALRLPLPRFGWDGGPGRAADTAKVAWRHSVRRR